MSKQLDAATIEALVSHGADLAKPRKTIHYFHARNQKSADALARKLQQDGRDIDVHDSGDEWAVVVTIVMLVGPSSIGQLRTEFVDAAKSAGAQYDGWEASLKQ